MRRRAMLVVCGFLAAGLAVTVIVILLNAGKVAAPPPPPERMMTLDVREAAPPAVMAEPAPPAMAIAPAPQSDDGGVPATDVIPVNVPQLAYRYELGYRLPGSTIAVAQQAHLTLCEHLGPMRCQLMSMERSTGDDGDATAGLKLRVASSLAPRFSAELGKAITKAGGRAADAKVTAEDVSKDLVDTAARLRQRQILVERLTAMLRNRQGRVSELVEAERSVAQAQEELDQAKGWLGELRGRVAYSDFTIRYTPVAATQPTPQNSAWKLSDALVQSGVAVVVVLRTLLILAIFLLPWALIGGAVAWALRRRLQRIVGAGRSVEA